MTSAIEHCYALMEQAGLPEISLDRSNGIDQILVNGAPVVRYHDENQIILIAGFSGCQVLVQTNPAAYKCVAGVTGDDEVIADISRIGGEELAMHLEQAWHVHASDAARGKR